MLTSDIVPGFRTADHDKDRSSHDVGRSHGSAGAIRELSRRYVFWHRQYAGTQGKNKDGALTGQLQSSSRPRS